MKVVIDTNVLISALIKDSTARRILAKPELDFYYPEIAFEELDKYKELVKQKSGMGETEYNQVKESLLNFVTVIPTAILEKHLEEAKGIMSRIDQKDVVFIATALSINGAVIWTDDADFKRQSKITTLTTKEIVDLNL